MRIYLLLVICFSPTFFAYAQQDTIVVTDYTSVLVATDPEGALYPVTSLDENKLAGFFLSEPLEGVFRICTADELFIWTNGKLLGIIENGCDFYQPQDFLSSTLSDTVFVAFSSEFSLSTLSCDLVIFEELQVIEEEVLLSRNVRSGLSEFVILAILVLLLLFGIIASAFPSRISYLLEKSFTLKASAYEFVNTSFFSAASMNLLILYALTLAFVGVYSDSILSSGLFREANTILEFVASWFRISSIVFALLIIKWIIIAMIASLFRLRDLRNYQLFDFLNFNLVLLIPILFILIFDFIMNSVSNTWISKDFILLFPVMMILFVLWFSLKFVNNSTRKKLSIISYLCATEIIPVIILLGWFFK